MFQKELVFSLLIFLIQISQNFQKIFSHLVKNYLIIEISRDSISQSLFPCKIAF